MKTLATLKYKFNSLAGLIRTTKNWPALLFWNYLGKNRKKKAYLRNGLVFTLRRRCADLSMLLETVDSRYYDSFRIGKGDIIDVGAHVGFFSIFISYLHPKRRILAFEPFPENLVLLRKNVKENKKQNIRIFNQAIGGKEGSFPFYPVKRHSGCHSLYNREGAGKPFKVKVTTLQKVFDEEKVQHCALLKMDCEGAEFPIILNAPSRLFKKIDIIAMEYHDYLVKNEKEELVDKLVKEGFAVELHSKLTFLYAKRIKRGP